MTVYIVMGEWPPTGFPGDMQPEREFAAVHATMVGAMSSATQYGTPREPWKDDVEVGHCAARDMLLRNGETYVRVEIRVEELGG
jgi:hypothetical protein